jgi:hypothetical protein
MLQAQIARNDRTLKQQQSPHPDHCAAAVKLEESIARATGCEARATPHKQGFRITLDQTAAERLAGILDGSNAPR